VREAVEDMTRDIKANSELSGDKELMKSTAKSIKTIVNDGVEDSDLEATTGADGKKRRTRKPMDAETFR